MKVTEIRQNATMLYNVTCCKSCLQRLGTTHQVIRFKSLYAVLGLGRNASKKDVRDAYIKLSKKEHPDQNRDGKKSHDNFVKINEAYGILSKPSSRRDYDAKLRFSRASTLHPRSSSAHRHPARANNYYSSEQFYEDRGQYGNFGPESHGPYSRRRHQQSNHGSFYHEPFSGTKSDFDEKQREKTAESTQTQDDKPRTSKSRHIVFYRFKLLAASMLILMSIPLIREIILDHNIQIKLKKEQERRAQRLNANRRSDNLLDEMLFSQQTNKDKIDKTP